MEKQYKDAEQALFHTVQYQDESNDSFLARADVLWSRLLARKVSLSDLQAFILLRGSGLSPEQKKPVILEADQSLDGSLTVQKVSESIRLLGASFFQDMAGQRKGPKNAQDQKVYSATNLMAEETDDAAFQAQEEMTEEEITECYLQEGDEDAALISDFEDMATELIQDDPDLASDGHPGLNSLRLGQWNTNRCIKRRDMNYCNKWL